MSHSVIDALKASGHLTPEDLGFLQEHGRAYRGIALPSRIRRRPAGSCFTTAEELEDLGEGRFVRGFALRPGSTKPLAHAWVTPDGQTAVDAVWSWSSSCEYFGIPGRRHESRLRRLSRRFVAQPLFDLGW